MIEWHIQPLRGLQRGAIVRGTKRGGLGAGLLKEGVISRVVPYQHEGREYFKLYGRWGNERVVTWVSSRHWDFRVRVDIPDRPAPAPVPAPARVEPRAETFKRDFVHDVNKKPKRFADAELKDAFL